jgi:hypothetical protein
VQRFTAATLAAWLAGTSAATAALWAKSGPAAFGLLPVLAVLLGIWLLCAGAMALLLRRRRSVTVEWMYAATVVSACLSAVLFFVLFAYPLMVGVPLGMLVAAGTFHVVVHALRTPDRST